jgi:hypothetical protein
MAAGGSRTDDDEPIQRPDPIDRQPQKGQAQAGGLVNRGGHRDGDSLVQMLRGYPSLITRFAPPPAPLARSLDAQ